MKMLNILKTVRDRSTIANATPPSLGSPIHYSKQLFLTFDPRVRKVGHNVVKFVNN